MDGEGIVHVLHCPQCGSDVLYFVGMGEEAGVVAGEGSV